MRCRSWIASGECGFVFNTELVATLVGPDLRRGDELFCLRTKKRVGLVRCPIIPPRSSSPQTSSPRRRPGPKRLKPSAVSQLDRKRRMLLLIFNSEFVEILVGTALRRYDERFGMTECGGRTLGWHATRITPSPLLLLRRGGRGGWVRCSRSAGWCP